MRRRVIPIALVATALSLAVGRPAAAAQPNVADLAERRDEKSLRGLIEQRADVNVPQPDGATALHWAAHWDDLTIATDLLRAGANPNAANDYGITPLLLAATN